MSENIVMPKLGESIAEGTIVKWLKEVGQSIEKDENILLISTDKVEAEIPSPISGILLSIDVKSGKTVPVGTVLGKITQTNEKILKTKMLHNIKKEKNVSISKLDTTKLVKNFLSPLVCSIMKENNITINDIKYLEGSGHNNRINKEDILNFIKKENVKFH